MRIGTYSFGDLHLDPHTGVATSATERLGQLLERAVLAEQVGLDYFGVGEHHRREYSVSNPGTVLAAIAARTSRISLGTGVTVLSTEDPVRLFQQFATLDLLSRGRAELTVGRGSFTESFRLFGASLTDYDELFAEKLDLLVRLNRSERVTWSGRFRAPLEEALVMPRPARPEGLTIRVGTGGNPQSSLRTGMLGLPIAYGVLGGSLARFAPLADLYWRGVEESPHLWGAPSVTVSTPGFITDRSQDAAETFYPYWRAMIASVAAERGFAPPSREQFDHAIQPGGPLLVGSPNEVADRILAAHSILGHAQHLVHMDFGGVPHDVSMHAIELLGTKVLPQIADA
ncbi:LLM class flavin-dependent oxidoreductase [Microbacterium sp. P05]|uniref:LLM class flavin-dependent oxidoreductase n=1 Tax=Microbacterium sp. P05 TaxID=3366948 RepID=UPI0037477ED4